MKPFGDFGGDEKSIGLRSDVGELGADLGWWNLKLVSLLFDRPKEIRMNFNKFQFNIFF